MVVLSTAGMDWNKAGPGGATTAIVTVIWNVVVGGWTPLVYVLGAAGLGRLGCVRFSRWQSHAGDLRATQRSLGTSEVPIALQAGLGLAILLTLSHLLGVLGLLSGNGMMPRVWAWMPVGLGVLLLADQVVRGSLKPERWGAVPKYAALWGPACGLLLVCACNPPGWLWTSEHGGFDVMSYHLQLPKEWATSDRVWPVHHNVYSYLPSYTECAYLHLAQMSPGSGDVLERTMGGEGTWVVSCQLLHAMLGVIAAIIVARAGVVAIRISGLGGRSDVLIGACAGLLLLSTPWTIVVSSLAYNEAAVLALTAAACLTAISSDLSSTRRGVLCALLLGVACGAKPTALLLLGPTVGGLLLFFTPRAHWPRALLLGTIAGVVSLSPWLVRNALDAGNPVFPIAAKLLGTGHWTLEQVQRYSANHHAEGSVLDRIARAVSSTFGLAHPQFGVTTLLALVGSLIALGVGRTHKLAAMLVVGVLLGVVAWAIFTHGQARFLTPLLVPMVMLVGLGVGAVPGIRHSNSDPSACPTDCPTDCRKRSAAIALVCVLIGVSSTALAAMSFLAQGKGEPNRLLPGGAGAITGLLFEQAIPQLPEARQREVLRELDNPIRFVNMVFKPQSTADVQLLLLGETSPLYYYAAGGSRSAIHYHTTWDRSPIGDAMEKSPNDPHAWTSHLRSLGYTHVLVNFDELYRLSVKDEYFDPRVKFEDVLAWAQSPQGGLVPLKDWPRTDTQGRALGGQALFLLEGAPTPTLPRGNDHGS